MVVHRSQVEPVVSEVPLGEYVAALYEAFLDEYGDADLAQLATAALVQERLLDAADDPAGAVRAA